MTPSKRAGHYVRQVNGYRAYIPAALPPQPPVRLNDRLHALLSQADRSLGRLDGSIQTLPHPDLFVAMYVRKEAVLSSQIEGTQSSLQDVLAAEAKVLAPDGPKDVDEVFNYVDAMNHGLARLGELPISVRLIREIHARLLSGVRGSHLTPGHVRTSQNWIGPPGSTLGEATFVPPPPDELPRALSDLERFIHSDAPMPLLVKIGLVHAQFETIHPFLDGNGRIGRLLITLLLCENDILLKPVLYLSHYFKQHRQAYYEHLQGVRDRGDWEGWLSFFLDGIITVSRQATDTARHILRLREDHRQLITERLGRTAANGHRLLEHLYQSPITSVNEVQALIQSSYPAANNLVSALVKNGVLDQLSDRKRNRRFIYQRYIELFHSPGE